MKKLHAIPALVALLSLASACSESITVDYSGPVADWPNYGAADGGGHYSEATQITPQNVHALEVAWEYRSGDVRMPGDGTFVYPPGVELPHMGSAWQMTPLLVDGTLYGCTAFNQIIALDPQTGVEKWRYDPAVDISKEVMVNCRGVSSWQDETDPAAHCSHRIFMGTMDGRLLAVDSKTGKLCTDFGAGGTVNLKTGLGEHTEYEYSAHSPPALLGDKLIIGARTQPRPHTSCP